MKNNFKFMAFAMMAVFSLAFISCNKDDDDIDPSISDSGALGAEPGTLVGDDAEANAKVESLRVASFGDFRYTYDKDGKLETISDRDYYTASAKDNFKVTYIWGGDDEYDEDICTFNIANNHIISASYSSNYREMYSFRYDIGQATGTMSYKYNSMGQLSSAIAAITAKGSYGGQDYIETENVTITFTYSSDNRLIKMEQYEEYLEKDGERCTDTRVYEYDYSRSYENKFYQYTPQLLEDPVPDDWVDAFAYVGLLGKASSALPGKYVKTYKYDSSTSGNSHLSSDTETCYYTFNSDGTIRSAGSQYDSDEYTYTTVGTRSAFETTDPVWQTDVTKVGRQPRRSLMRSLRARHRLHRMK